MKFFTPQSDFTHYGRFYGFPAYFAGLESDGPMIAGTNVIWDWCVKYIAPQLQWIVEALRFICDPSGYEPRGFSLEVRGELIRDN